MGKKATGRCRWASLSILCGGGIGKGAGGKRWVVVG